MGESDFLWLHDDGAYGMWMLQDVSCPFRHCMHLPRFHCIYDTVYHILAPYYFALCWTCCSCLVRWCGSVCTAQYSRLFDVYEWWCNVMAWCEPARSWFVTMCRSDHLTWCDGAFFLIWLIKTQMLSRRNRVVLTMRTMDSRRWMSDEMWLSLSMMLFER